MTSSQDNPDYVPLTRALRRSLSRWRLFAFAALALTLTAFSVRLVSEFKTPDDYIALNRRGDHHRRPAHGCNRTTGR